MTLILRSLSFLLVAILVEHCCLSVATFSRIGLDDVDNIMRRESRLLPIGHDAILSYQPLTNVIDQAAIDLDQKALVEQLNSLNVESVWRAYSIYSNGCYSRSYAYITLQAPSVVNATQGTLVKGISVSKNLVYGILKTNLQEGDQTINVLYETKNVKPPKLHVECQVGGNPEPILDGCFASTGTVAIGGSIGQNKYSYLPKFDNRNDISLKKLSTEAHIHMWSSKSNNFGIYHDFEIFYNYYGRSDYADEWIQSAFGKHSTTFTNGNIDFTNYSRQALAETIQKATLYMSVRMHVVGMVESAVDACYNGCINTSCIDNVYTSNDMAQAAENLWDQAVAFYTGLQKIEDGQNDSYLLYALANEQCSDFATCNGSRSGNYESKIKGVAQVNIEIFNQFIQGQQNIVNERCFEAKINKERIVQLTTVPLVQGTLNSAYLIDNRQRKGITNYNNIVGVLEAQGAIFAASVIPIVHFCNPDDAQIIYQYMVRNDHVLAREIFNNSNSINNNDVVHLRSTGIAMTNNTFSYSNVTLFRDVRDAFERNYACMGITCEEVGFLEGAEAYDVTSLCYFVTSSLTSTQDSIRETIQGGDTFEPTQRENMHGNNTQEPIQGDDAAAQGCSQEPMQEDDVTDFGFEDDIIFSLDKNLTTNNTGQNSTQQFLYDYYGQPPRPPGHRTGYYAMSSAAIIQSTCYFWIIHFFIILLHT